ncbi:COP9 signalosome complex subunit CsnD [Histoplasma capsulatum var. duboisii H88]|uniref:COP9 signalosome complex subunit 4 n=2 Tax=Ajellomyces capsulatus TaxID=5037 RepID=F0UEL2_AJEC8|nr:COP9 signalosome subunit CsnD [Histoplasma capsulatum H143]EGC44742.1 COP9 signalosome complex subunit CsnD [Histoplasma capsulatum var. duboisii H88]
MADPNVTSSLASIESTTNQQSKPQLYNELLSKIISSPSSPNIKSNLNAFLNSILGETVGIVAARPLLDNFINSLRNLPAPIIIAIGQDALSEIQSHSTSAEAQDTVLREILADAYEAEENFTQAAKVLQAIRFDSSQHLMSDDAKVRIWIRIVRLYLEEDDTTNAESFLNRVKNMPTKIQDPELKLHFQLSQARISDFNRRFLDASQQYLNLSLSGDIEEGDRLQALSAAIICAVLGPAGPQRSRTLSRLYKDDRSSSLDVYNILEKIFMDRLLTAGEVKAFAEKLVPHQLAVTADGSTVLGRAVIEHNLLAASRLYENIHVEELGNILGLEASGDLSAGERAEAYAARMLEQGRLKGTIDQIKGVIYFDSGIPGVGPTAEAAGRSLRAWDAGVQNLAEEVESVAAAIIDEFPDFAATQMQNVL